MNGTTTGLVVWLTPLGQAAETPQEFAEQVAQGPDYQPYIFWAYAVVCVLLLIFTLWSVLQLSDLGRKVDDLTKRFDEANPQ